MGNITEAERSIKQAKGQWSSSLVLTRLGLTNEDLAHLMPQIKGIRSLRNLDLRWNELTNLPPEIGELTKLTKLQASFNQIDSLPPEIGQLQNLQEFWISNNQLPEFPREIERLPNLRNLYATDNPLTNEAILNITANLGDHVVTTDLAARFRANNYREVIQQLYGDQSAAKLAQINAMDQGAFEPAEGSRLTGKNVLVKFLEAIPTSSAAAGMLYIPAAKLILDRVFETTAEERDTNLQKIATSLGNCPTPVQGFLTQITIDESIPRDENGNVIGSIPKLIDTLIKREALEEFVIDKLKDSLPKNETIEITQALLNSVYLGGAENIRVSKVKIEGDRNRVPSKSVNVDYGFFHMTEALAKEFAQLICKTDEAGELLIQNDKYQLDPSKIRAINEPHFAGLGILTDREKLIVKLENQLQNVIVQNDLTSQHENADAVSLLKINEQKEQLRTLLITTEDNAIQSVANNFIMDRVNEASSIRAGISTHDLSQLGKSPSATNRSRSNSNDATDTLKKAPARRMSR